MRPQEQKLEANVVRFLDNAVQQLCALPRSAPAASPRAENPQAKNVLVWVSGDLPVDLGIPPLDINDLTESNPRNPRFSVTAYLRPQDVRAD